MANIEWAISAISEVSKTRTDLQSRLNQLEDGPASDELQDAIESLYEASGLLGRVCGRILVSDASAAYSIQ